MMQVGKILAVVCTLAYGASALCRSTNPGGATCLEAADLPTGFHAYMGGQTCFDFSGGNVRKYYYHIVHVICAFILRYKHMHYYFAICTLHFAVC